jgi:hypothetical protein
MVLIGQLHNPLAEEKIGFETVTRAVNYFEEEIRANLHRRQENRAVLIQELLDILNLPMWRHRWYLYEVWASMQVVTALCEYDARLVLSDDTLRFEAGHATCIAELDTAANIRIELWAQKQTPVSGIPGRRAIMPDLRLCLPDGDSPEGTIALVEFKQRKSMSRPKVIQLVNLYDMGTPRSLGNFYLNYDAFPDGIEVEVSKPNKSFLFGFLNPQYPDHITLFQHKLVEVLKAGGYEPVGGRFDALLLDVSGSMRRMYTDPTIIRDLERIVHLNPGVRVYFFDTHLIDPGDTRVISSPDGINRHLGGGTQLENALQELAVKEPGATKLLVITDGRYGDTPSLKKYQAVECLPADLYQVVSDIVR